MLINRRTLLSSAAACLCAGPGLAMDTDAPPAARIAPVTDNIFGTRVTDPYRWMEDVKSAEFQTYLKQQGEHAAKVLGRIPGRDSLAAAISRSTAEKRSVREIQVAGDTMFVDERPAGSASYRLVARSLGGGNARTLVDPDARADGRKHALIWWRASPDGSLVMFGIAEDGSEDVTARIIETATGRLLPETIDRIPHNALSWADDSKSVVYNRLSGQDRTATDYFARSVAWRHRVGTDPAQDTKVLAQGQYKAIKISATDFPAVAITKGAATAVAVLFNGVQSELTAFSAPLASLGKTDTPWRPVFTPEDKITAFFSRGDELYLITFANAPRFALLRTSAASPAIKHAAVVVPESENLLDTGVAARDAIYVFGRDSRGLSNLRRLRDDGSIETLALPFDGSITSPVADPRRDGAWFLLESWTRPTTVCYAGRDGSVRVIPFDTEPRNATADYVSEMVLVTARDGTRVPLSIIYKRGLKRDGSAPTILSAYGAYGVSYDPEYAPRFFAWLELGGIHAIAHVRGGGEFGHDWYLAGKNATKPNTWRDMIDCAKCLIAEKWTSTPRLAIEGTSAGGIAVGRALTERPDLFAVALSRVGVSNAARSEFSPNGPPNIPEFGSVTDPQTAPALVAMDAFYAVRDGTKYPAVLLTTGMNDPRVSPWEPGKMAARLQAASASDNPVLLRVDAQGGHGMGATRNQLDGEYADLFAFALWRMGDPRFQPANRHK